MFYKYVCDKGFVVGKMIHPQRNLKWLIFESEMYQYAVPFT